MLLLFDVDVTFKLNLWVDVLRTSCAITLKQVAQSPFDNNIGSINGFLPSGHNSLSDPCLCRYITPLGHIVISGLDSAWKAASIKITQQFLSFMQLDIFWKDPSQCINGLFS